jgi:hypothetical protein
MKEGDIVKHKLTGDKGIIVTTLERGVLFNNYNDFGVNFLKDGEIVYEPTSKHEIYEIEVIF